MSVLTTILGGGLKDLVLGVLDRIKLNPEKRAEVELKLAENAHELAKLEAAYETKLLEVQAKEVEIASSNIRAEAGADGYTSRARPTFLYICNAILAWNYIAVPLFPGKTPIDLPEPLFWLFGSVMLGYVGARTWEKVYKTEGKK